VERLASAMGEIEACPERQFVTSIYIILNTVGVGGAEKRFTDNWHQLLNDFSMDVHLVIDAYTHAGLISQAGYSEKLLPNKNLHVLNFGSGRFKEYCKSVNAFLATRPKGGLVHFPLAAVPGIRRRFGHKIVVSWVNSAMPPLNIARWKLGLGAWMGLLTADKVDILNPENFRIMSKVPGMRGKLSLTTGGTQVDGNHYRAGVKECDLVFLGRLEPEKQCQRFVNCLPELHELLINAGHLDYRFRIVGDGSEALALKKIISNDVYKKIPVEIGYSSQPEKVLSKAAVYFSLQKTSNYPSKALAEAIVCGAYPVLTNVGESNLMVEECPYYALVPRDFTANDLFDAILNYLNMSEENKKIVAISNSSFGNERFAMGRQALYFYNLYNQLLPKVFCDEWK
jgi:glycosyltransferase involved in cell wall biosynthesis